jgi:predicted metalloprotease with PDZ domain
MTEDQFVQELAHRAGIYLTALRKLGLVDGGSSKLSGGEDSYNIVYSGGMMAALVMDSDIRAANRGRRSLDDVMAAFESRYAAAAGPEVTLDGVRRTFAGFGVPAPTFIAQIEGRAPLPLAETFARYGLVMSVTETSDAVKVTLARSPKSTKAQRDAWKLLIAQP